MNALDYLTADNLFGATPFYRYILNALYRFVPFVEWNQIFSIISLVLLIGCIVAKYILFEKAGERGWKSLIPFYSEITLSKIITGKKVLGIVWIASILLYQIVLTAVLFIPPEILLGLLFYLTDLFRYIMIVVTAFVSFKFGRAYGKSVVWSAAMIFLSDILIIVMGFDKKVKYTGLNGAASVQSKEE
ncbi:MAG: hypothetical protein IKN85_00325 [Oscillospiraceae bacterium]|nr:hypothetical protein [Oscillospiraceae bacterium]MBR3534250.1 hypothetical protein [Oscillospiraceae bacterium]MBR6835361.1 hypothetical protein [Oscillospiraceae bacterium]